MNTLSVVLVKHLANKQIFTSKGIGREKPRPCFKRYEPMKVSLYTLIFSIFLSLEVCACPAPPPGYGLSHSQLIEKTTTIVLAKTIKVTDKVVVFELVENIKGESEKEFFWRRSRIPKSVKHISTDFNRHIEPTFWSNSLLVRRSPPSKGGICNIAFTYELGEVYLVFRESWGHAHSNEIIKSEDDKWLAYVKESVASGL
ncbi:hypothetical protein [Shewanella algicola]|uniref:Uncharacterized protein n=2 Tax=Shewanella algicola TaxID=640633 RepID=A0A9X1ZF70_9GAMM|nr:hypothetical protein [Shewanella algicola]MCL1107600.1 hypothetical protein [Shewanella algicola]